jgi:hypothetical protein
VCIIWGGAYDVAKNLTGGGLRRLRDFVAEHNHTNLVVMNVLHRHDLQINSCVNNEVKVFNRKLKKHSKVFAHLRPIEVINSRELYTRHGVHLDWKGKKYMAKKSCKCN